MSGGGSGTLGFIHEDFVLWLFLCFYRRVLLFGRPSKLFTFASPFSVIQKRNVSACVISTSDSCSSFLRSVLMVSQSDVD
jgi:hypothetical protein